MTPGARISAAIEILDQVLDGASAEKTLTSWARRSRFAGSKDRAAIRDHVFQALRCRNSYAALGGALTGRGLMIGAVRASGAPVDTLFSGEGHAPDPVTPEETGHDPQSDPEIYDMPEWLVARFRSALGPAALSVAQNLRGRAPVCLRVNRRRMPVARAQDVLASEGIETRPVNGVETALIVTSGERKVALSEAYQSGLVELQDAASQAAMQALSEYAVGKVLDFCAGGGGKILALAAQSDAACYAHDIDTGRMADLTPRAARAGVSVTKLEPGKAAGAAPYDLVLCDAPCSGSGTWRRAPEAKWALTEQSLGRYHDTQLLILEEAQALVGPRGHLAYATCSVLDEENTASINAFLERHADWRCEFARSWPVSPDHDGFFMALLSRTQP